MEDEERPRKFPKLDDSEAKGSGLHEGEIDSTMTGALQPANQDTGHADAPKQTSGANGDGKEGEITNDLKPVEPSTTEGSGESREDNPTLSKHQQKKLRRKEQWEAGREGRKAKRKEKVLAKRERKKVARAETRNNAAAGEGTEGEAGKAAINTSVKRRYQSTLVPLTIVLDCSFDDLMLDKERISLSSQLTRSYSDNSRAPYHTHLVISSFDKLLKQRFETVLAKTHENWKGIRFMQEDYVHAAELAKDWMKEPGKQGRANQLAGVFADKPDAKPEDGEIVYLSSDSPHTLTELKPYSTYIIGGLVDKNRHKGICYKQASERGIKTAKLPIGDYIQMASRSVLTTNHVVEIMLRWLELGDWGKAFMQVIPSRKGGVLKGAGRNSAENEAHEDHEVQVESDENDEEADAANVAKSSENGAAGTQSES